MFIPEYDRDGKSLREPATGYDVPYYTSPGRYKVFRQAAPTSDEPYQLPEGTAIDLRASGVGINDYFYVQDRNDNSQGVQILFTPEGRVARVSYSQLPIDSDESETFDKPVVDNIFLLVGKRENVPAPPADVDPTLDTVKINAATTDEARQRLKEPINWLGPESRWVVIGSQSGRVVTIEKGFVELLPVAIFSGNFEEKRNQQILAAREFTREMAQLGGR
jgi:hypothetical protein